MKSGVILIRWVLRQSLPPCDSRKDPILKMKEMVQQKRCPACLYKGMSVFIEIEDLPVHCNLLWPSQEAALNAPRGDIRLAFCHACGMVSNLSFDPGRMQYTQAYENSLHFSPHFQAYAQELATQLIEKYNLYGKDVVELGCGKGEFLSMLCEGGRNRGFGFDPSYNGDREGPKPAKNITFIRDFYSETYAGYTGDLICCRHVLEHIQHPHDFLSQLRRTIGDRHDTVVFFEVPNVLYTLRDLGIWDIIYEHCSYFASSSLARVFAGAGFKVLDLYDAYNGQFLCIETSPVHETPDPQAVQPEILGEMSTLVPAFAENYRKKVEEWRLTLRRTGEEEKRVVIWGAGSKGVSFLNTLGVTNQIEYVVDINPYKQGMFVAGTGQCIVAPDFLQDYQPHIVLVMNPVYRDEIAKSISDLGLSSDLIPV